MTEQTITEYYQKDHARLDELFINFQMYKRKDFQKAKDYFKQFKFGLQRHIVWEEDVLFPYFEKKTGMSNAGPTQVMRTDHKQIGEYLESIHKKVQKDDLNSDIEEQNLLSALSHHNLKEEKILYPSIDGLANENEKKEIFKAMDNIPEERYKQCCISP